MEKIKKKNTKNVTGKYLKRSSVHAPGIFLKIYSKNHSLIYEMPQKKILKQKN